MKLSEAFFVAALATEAVVGTACKNEAPKQMVEMKKTDNATTPSLEVTAPDPMQGCNEADDSLHPYFLLEKIDSGTCEGVKEIVQATQNIIDICTAGEPVDLNDNRSTRSQIVQRRADSIRDVLKDRQSCLDQQASETAQSYVTKFYKPVATYTDKDSEAKLKACKNAYETQNKLMLLPAILDRKETKCSDIKKVLAAAKNTMTVCSDVSDEKTQFKYSRLGAKRIQDVHTFRDECFTSKDLDATEAFAKAIEEKIAKQRAAKAATSANPAPSASAE